MTIKTIIHDALCIADIRKMGYNVKTRIVSRNRKNYAEYYLEA